MKKERLKYMGWLNDQFIFSNGKADKMKFSKCRKDLIEDYKLWDKNSVNEWFEISYFEVKPLSLKEMENHTLIISDINTV